MLMSITKKCSRRDFITNEKLCRYYHDHIIGLAEQREDRHIELYSNAKITHLREGGHAGLTKQRKRRDFE